MEVTAKMVRNMILGLKTNPGDGPLCFTRELGEAMLLRLAQSFEIELNNEATAIAARTMLERAIEVLDRIAGISPEQAVDVLGPAAERLRADESVTIKIARLRDQLRDASNYAESAEGVALTIRNAAINLLAGYWSGCESMVAAAEASGVYERQRWMFRCPETLVPLQEAIDGCPAVDLVADVRVNRERAHQLACQVENLKAERERVVYN